MAGNRAWPSMGYPLDAGRGCVDRSSEAAKEAARVTANAGPARPSFPGVALIAARTCSYQA
jgi:hypothetical protein